MFDNLEKLLLISCKGSMWKSFKKQPLNEKHELIEMAVCFLDLKSLEENVIDYIIKPQNSKISKFCTKHTGLTQEDVDKGVFFEVASRELLTSHFAADHIHAGWGLYGRRQIKKQCEDAKIPYPFSPNYINLQLLFSLFYGLDKFVSLEEALKIAFPEEKFEHIRASDELKNLSKLTIHLIQKIRTK